MEGMESEIHISPTTKLKAERGTLSMCCYSMHQQQQHGTEKDKLLDDLQQALTAISPDQPYVILGDLNTRVGYSFGD